MKTIYGLTHGEYSDYNVECLFVNEEDAKAAFAKVGGEAGDYRLESFPLFESVPKIIESHSMDCEYAPDGSLVEDCWHRIYYTIVKDDDSEAHELTPRIYLKNATRVGSKNRELHVTGPSREECVRVHRHYVSKIFDMELRGQYDSLNLEWPA